MGSYKLIFPQEVEVHYIIPAMRRAFALHMKTVGLEQKKIASLLHVSEAAISQYLSDKRATEVTFSEAVQAEIRKATPKIIALKNFKEEGSRILDFIKNEKTTCKICTQVTHQMSSKECTLCFDHVGKKEMVQIRS